MFITLYKGVELNKYEIITTLGDGATSQVFLGRKQDTKEYRAIKVFNTEYMKGKDVAIFLHDEIEILYSLNHKNIVKMYEFGNEGILVNRKRDE